MKLIANLLAILVAASLIHCHEDGTKHSHDEDGTEHWHDEDGTEHRHDISERKSNSISRQHQLNSRFRFKRRPRSQQQFQSHRRRRPSFGFPQFKRPVWSRPFRPSYHDVLRIKRTKFVYVEDLYGEWSNWSNCSSKHCNKFRQKKCLDDSYRNPIKSLVGTVCPVKYVVQVQNCNDTEECQTPVFNETAQGLPSQCGVVKQSGLENKVVGGKQSVPHSWPWHAALGFMPRRRAGYRPPKLQYFCSATLISPTWLLTAAHCLEAVDNRMFTLGKLVSLKRTRLYRLLKIRLGDHHRHTTEKFQQDHDISHVILHPAFHSSRYSNENDVALIKLVRPVQFTKEITPACLPKDRGFRLPAGTKCTTMGWGHTRVQASRSPWEIEFANILEQPSSFGGFGGGRTVRANYLKEVTIPLVEFGRCSREYGRYGLDKDLHVCAGEYRKDSCKGDSGGGLHCQHPITRAWTVYGVTNFGSARGCGQSYGVYARVAQFTEWISKIVK